MNPSFVTKIWREIKAGEPTWSSKFPDILEYDGRRWGVAGDWEGPSPGVEAGPSLLDVAARIAATAPGTGECIVEFADGKRAHVVARSVE